MVGKAKSYFNRNVYDVMIEWINAYFLGKHLVFIKNDSTQVAGVLAVFDKVNATGDTYVLRVKNNSGKDSTILLDDIIHNVYTKIIISDLDDRSKSGFSILDSGALSDRVVKYED